MICFYQVWPVVSFRPWRTRGVCPHHQYFLQIYCSRYFCASNKLGSVINSAHRINNSVRCYHKYGTSGQICGISLSVVLFVCLFWPVSQFKSDWQGVQPAHQDVCLDIMNSQTHLELRFGEVSHTKWSVIQYGRPANPQTHRLLSVHGPGGVERWSLKSENCLRMTFKKHSTFNDRKTDANWRC